MILRLPNPMSAVVWLAFLVPGSLFMGAFDRSLVVAVFLLSCAVLISKPSPWEARRPSSMAFKIFLLLEISCLVSYLYSAAFNGIPIGPRDWFELLRYLFLGAFVIYMIRHYNARVHVAMDWAMAAALYLSLVFQPADQHGYVSLLTLCYLLFFSRLRLRYLHAVAAALAVFFNGAVPSWRAALLVLSAALAVRLYRALSKKRASYAAMMSILFFLLCLAATAVCVHGSTAAPAPQAVKLIRISPLLGWGPSAFGTTPAQPDQYELWLLKGGALGTGLILTGLALAGYRLLNAARGDLTHLVGAAAFIASVVLMLFFGAFLESFRLFSLTAFFMAGIHEACR